MSNKIKFTQEDIQVIHAEFWEEFSKEITKNKMADGKFTFTKTFPKCEDKATVLMTPLAWAKTVRLLNEFDKEVAWHGVSSRVEGQEHTYIIKDIVVYPQEVTAATVDMDEQEYTNWIIKNGDDERFYELNMQAHSHVNMGVTPSGTDTGHHQKILDALGKDDFYIFMIWNKSHKLWTKIYDFKTNLMFDPADITVTVQGSEGLDDFVKEAKELVKARVTTYGSQYYNGYNHGAYYQGSAYNYGSTAASKKDDKPAATPPASTPRRIDSTWKT